MWGWVGLYGRPLWFALRHWFINARAASPHPRATMKAHPSLLPTLAPTNSAKFTILYYGQNFNIYMIRARYLLQVMQLMQTLQVMQLLQIQVANPCQTDPEMSFSPTCHSSLTLRITSG
jgi:hypothetical protein